MLCTGLLCLQQAGAPLCCGFSCCRASALSVWASVPALPGSGAWAQKLWCRGLVAPRHVESSQTEDLTHDPCIGSGFLPTAPAGKSQPAFFKSSSICVFPAPSHLPFQTWQMLGLEDSEVPRAFAQDATPARLRSAHKRPGSRPSILPTGSLETVPASPQGSLSLEARSGHSGSVPLAPRASSWGFAFHPSLQPCHQHSFVASS